MQTFQHVLRNPVLVESAINPNGDLPSSWPPKSMPLASDGSRIPLPRTLAGFGSAWATSPLPSGAGGAAVNCKVALVCTPTLVIPLCVPPDEELAAAGIVKNRPSESFSRFLVAACLQLPDESRLLGWAVITIHVNCLGMGQNKIVEFDSEWATDPDDLLMGLVARIGLIPAHLAATRKNEPRSGMTVVVFLAQDLLKSSTWRRELDLLGAILGLHIEPILKADDIQPKVLMRLRTSPPDALIISVHQLRHAQLFRDTYETARPGAPIAEFQLTSSDAWGQALDELAIHLLLISAEPVTDAGPIVDWEEAKERIFALEGAHFILSDRVKKNLPHCKYPHPHRMVWHVKQLAGLANEYGSKRGQLGARIEDVGLSGYQIEIALKDRSLKTPAICVDGQELMGLSAEPHVKVDDVKSPADCGRIYFAIDREGLAFIVDHIGLHDYSRQ